jgi:hypothetical protein
VITGLGRQAATCNKGRRYVLTRPRRACGLAAAPAAASGGKLTKAALPASVGQHFYLQAISRVPGSTGQLAAGNAFIPASNRSDGIVLRYS